MSLFSSRSSSLTSTVADVAGWVADVAGKTELSAGFGLGIGAADVADKTVMAVRASRNKIVAGFMCKGEVRFKEIVKKGMI